MSTKTSEKVTKQELEREFDEMNNYDLADMFYRETEDIKKEFSNYLRTLENTIKTDFSKYDNEFKGDLKKFEKNIENILKSFDTRIKKIEKLIKEYNKPKPMSTDVLRMYGNKPKNKKKSKNKNRSRTKKR